MEKRNYNNTSRNVKKATDGKGMDSVVRPPKWEPVGPQIVDREARKQRLAGQKAKIMAKNAKVDEVFVPVVQPRVSEATILALAQGRSQGKTIKELSAEYALSESYIDTALRTQFVGSKQGKQVLKGLMIENAIGASMHVKKNMADLTPMQAAVVTGIMTSNVIALEKHDANADTASLDFESIGQIAGTLRQLNALAQDLQ